MSGAFLLGGTIDGGLVRPTKYQSLVINTQRRSRRVRGRSPSLESAMTLMLHAGANPVDYEVLRAVPVPPPTDTHVPVPHHEIVELMRFTLGFHQHEISEEHHAVTCDGARYFGVLCLRSPYGEYTDMLGLRNSHDKSLPIGIAFGSRVFVCDNLAFSADHVIKRKHTVRAKRELPGLLADIIQPLKAQRIAQNEKLLTYQASPVSDAAADQAIMQMYRQDIIGVQRICGRVGAMGASHP